MNLQFGRSRRIFHHFEFCVAFIALAAVEVRADQAPATTPLTRAIRVEDFAAAKGNITHESVNQPDLGGYHPLTYAVYTRNSQLVKALLDGGSNPNTVEYDESTALSIAAQLDLPEIIKTLHRGGATYPVGAHVCPPIANAIRADAVESFKVLLELYPGLDINAGWPWPKDQQQTFPQTGTTSGSYSFADSALLFATITGSDEMAQQLLKHGANISTQNKFGSHALHNAAWDSRISATTVAALIKAGLSPTTTYYHEHYRPSSPLELACAAGSLDKVKLLAKGLSARNQDDILRRAALIAAAHDHGEITDFLYQKVGEKTPTLERYIREHPDPRANNSEADVSIPLGNISETMPTAHPDMTGTQQREGTIAVIASPALLNHATMLTQSLSNVDGMTVVDRDHIDHAAAEKLLGQLGGTKKSSGPFDFSLVPAAELVVLEDIKISGRQFIKLTLISTRTRVVELRMVLDHADADETWVKTKLAALLDTLQRIKKREPGAVALSLIRLTPTTPSRECLELARYANLLLPTKVSQQPGAILLNLQQMRHLEMENAIAGEASYWKAAWVIEGSLSLDTSTSARLILGATPTSGAGRVEVTAECAPEQLADALSRTWQELSKKLSPGDKTNNNQPVKNTVGTGEAEELVRQSRWFVDASYPEDAYQLASAAFILGNRSQDLLRAMTEAVIDRLPLLQNRCGQYGAWDPRVMEPAIRFRMASAIPDYLTLCDSARLYVATLKKPLIGEMRASGGYRGRAESYNEVVSQALGELQFFRQMMNDDIISRSFGNELWNLDQQISLLTLEFAAKFKDHKTERYTLANLVFNTNQFYAKHNPELLKRLLDRLAVLVEGNDNYIAYRVVQQFIERLEKYPNECLNSSAYTTAIQAMASSQVLLRQRPYMTELLRAVAATRTTDRVAAMRRMLEVAAQSESGFPNITFNIRPWERFLGGRPPGDGISLVGSRDLHGGIGSLILHQPVGFEKTGEFSRLAGGYLGILYWSRMEPPLLDQKLKLAADQFFECPEEHRPPASDIPYCRALLESIGRLTPANAKILDQLAPAVPVKKDVSSENERLALKPLLSLPQSPDLSQFARWTQAVIDGDQLWLPTTYVERPAYLWGTAYEAIHGYNAIHVIGLTDHSVRTIKIPCDVDDKEHAELYRPSQRYDSYGNPSVLKRIVLGSKHAYFMNSNSNSTLSVIDRQTLEVKQLKLPLPYLIGISACAHGDTLYLSIAKEWNNPSSNADRGASAVVVIEGAEITDTIVSNQRKPQKTPLDEPMTWVDTINVRENNLILISNSHMGNINPDSYQGAAYDWSGGVWKKFAKRELDQARKQAFDSFAKQFSGHRQVDLGQSPAFFTEDLFEGGIPAALVMVNDPESQLEFRPDWIKRHSMAGKIKLVPLSAKPLTGEAQMDRQMFVLNAKNAGGSGGEVATRSANQIIESAMYDASVCFKWRDEFLVFLTYRGVAMPAIWTAPESEIKRLASPPKTR